MGQYVDALGDVISHLNISHVRTDDGGLYKCIATNSIGSASHAARLNVFGPPYVRTISPIKAIAGEDLLVYCPFSGYPIESIRWEKTGIEITASKQKFQHEISHEILKFLMISLKICATSHQIFSKAASSKSIRSIRLTIQEAIRASFEQEAAKRHVATFKSMSTAHPSLSLSLFPRTFKRTDELKSVARCLPATCPFTLLGTKMVRLCQ